MPLRNPFITARNLTTLDYLSNGRTILGVGVGWLKEEFHIVNESYEQRGRRTDECIEVLRALWEQEEPLYKGRFFAFPAVEFEPKPAQRQGIPIFIGGDSDAALIRAAKLGNGWLGRVGDAQLKHRIQRLHDLRRDYSREHMSFEISIATPWQIDMNELKELEQLGVTRTILMLDDVKSTEVIATIEALAARVLKNQPS